jgi:hypothetical protein
VVGGACGTTEETSAKGNFHLLTNANWLLKRGYKNGSLIFGETPVIRIGHSVLKFSQFGLMSRFGQMTGITGSIGATARPVSLEV